jgi:hypothetical protein
MWREATGKVVFSRRLERAFDCIFGIKNKNQEIYFLRSQNGQNGQILFILGEQLSLISSRAEISRPDTWALVPVSAVFFFLCPVWLAPLGGRLSFLSLSPMDQ